MLRYARPGELRVYLLRSFLMLLLLPTVAFAGPNDNHETIVLVFESTALLAPAPPAGWPITTSPWPPNGTNASVKGLDATGQMEIRVLGGRTHLRFFVRGARPNT